MKYAVTVFDLNENLRWEYQMSQLCEAIDRAEYECEKPNCMAQVVNRDTGEVVYEIQS